MSSNDVPDQVGLIEKFDVTRRDGKPDGPYFVLSARDPNAPAALIAYAAKCAPRHPQLSHDLHAMAKQWQMQQEIAALRAELFNSEIETGNGTNV